MIKVRLALLIAAVAAMVGAVPVPASAGAAALLRTGDWPMYADGPSHNAVNRAETTLSPTSVAGLHITHTYPKWNLGPAPRGGNFPYKYTPVIVGSLAYGVGSGFGYGYIRAFYVPSGGKAWQQQICSYKAPCGFYPPAVSQGVVFVGGNSAMYAFAAGTGQPLWTTTIGPGGPFLEITVSGSTVYAATKSSGTVYAFDVATGRILWSATPGCCVSGAVTVAGGLAYVVTDHLVAYNAVTGAPVFSALAAFSSVVAVSSGIAYLLSPDCVLEAFNASSGAPLWSAPTGTAAGWCDSSQSIAVDGGIVVMGSGFYLNGVAAATGATLWRLGDGSTYFWGPAIANGVVYVGEGGPVRALLAVDETTGRVLHADAVACTTPVVAHGAVYAWCINPNLPSVMTIFGL